MKLQSLREEVLEANLEVVRRGLVLYTFGNASGIDRASGLVAIKPSGVPYETMKPSDLVVVDLGATYKDYWSDYMRMASIGEPTEEQRAFFACDLASQKAGVEAIRPGIPTKAIFQACADVIKAMGFEEHARIERVGHGVGLDVHEPPSIAFNGETIVEPGMVLTVEPIFFDRPDGKIGNFALEDVVAVTETGGKMTLTGSGTDIWNNSDQFTFAYKNLNGDGSIVARVVNKGTGSNTWAKGGVMIRDSLDGGSTHAMMILSANSDGAAGNGASFQWRPAANGASSNTDAASAIPAPYWVKIERIGDNLAGYVSVDGKTWRPQGVPQTIAMTAPVYIGICVTSHAAGEQRAFQFEGIATTGGVTGQWQGAVIDSPQYNGKANLYVTVEDSAGKSATASDPALANTAAWTEWKIPLSSLTGVNLAKVKKLYLGVGDRASPAAGGSGRIYIDEIRVTRP